VFTGAGGYGSAAQFVDGFGPAIAVGAGLSLLGAAIALALPGRRAAVAVTESPEMVAADHVVTSVAATIEG
jgi:hypothetical protein